MSTYEPGTVAVATVNGVMGVRVIRDHGCWAAVGGDGYVSDSAVTNVRPLVVLDPIALGWASGSSIAACLRHHERSSCGLFDKLADQIEAQTKPPRIPEPGLWGVVAVNGRIYVRTTIEGVWRSGDYTAKWDDIADGAVLVREGIES